jgi:hypothetical protein
MVPDNKNNVDPTVQAIVELFPDDFLRNAARRRERIHAFTLGKGVYATSRPIIN